ncbi:MAG TPA: ABC transporter permease [Solirubrobacterales bacterium]
MAGSQTAVPVGPAAMPPDPDRSIETRFRWGFRHYLRRYGPIAVVVVNLTVFFFIWQALAVNEVINPLFLPSVTDMFGSIRDGFADGTLGAAVLWSFRHYLLGLGLACAVGIPLGLLMGASKVVYAIFSPYMWALQSLPRVALMPLLILFFGFTAKAEVTLIFLSAVFPIMINCMSGVKTVEPSLLRAGRVFGASRLDMYRRIIFPYTLPFILSGVNQGLTRGLVGMVIAEIFTGKNGLGFLVQYAGNQFDTPRLYGVLLIIMVFSLCLVQLARWVEIKAAPWRNQGIGM